VYDEFNPTNIGAGRDVEARNYNTDQIQMQMDLLAIQ